MSAATEKHEGKTGEEEWREGEREGGTSSKIRDEREKRNLDRKKLIDFGMAREENLKTNIKNRKKITKR